MKQDKKTNDTITAEVVDSIPNNSKLKRGDKNSEVDAFNVKIFNEVTNSLLNSRGEFYEQDMKAFKSEYDMQDNLVRNLDKIDANYQEDLNALKEKHKGFKDMDAYIKEKEKLDESYGKQKDKTCDKIDESNEKKEERGNKFIKYITGVGVLAAGCVVGAVVLAIGAGDSDGNGDHS